MYIYIGYAINLNCFKPTCVGVVFDTKIDMFLNTKSKVSSLREVFILQLIFLNSKCSFEELFRFLPSDSTVACDIFTPPDTK